jgi:LL-H family phage holin
MTTIVEPTAAIDITKIVVAAIGLADMVLTGFLIPYIKSKSKYWKEQSEGEQAFNVRSWVKYAVEAAEMLYTGPGRGAEKLDYVIDYITRLLISKGITMDQQQVRMMIESTLLELKNSLLK